MAVELTWLGHGCWSIVTGEHQILLDPFLDDSPASPLKSTDLSPQFMLVSHGHFDHMADVVKIARRTDALVIANFELCQWFAAQGVKNTLGMNLGGSTEQPFGKVKLTLAHHSSTLPDGTAAGNPCGFVVTLNKCRIYFACDTALFYDMKLIGAAGLDLAVLPLGDLFTMGPDDTIEAIKLLEPKRVAPSHYNTWPPISQDAQAWAERVRAETRAEPMVLQPGEKIVLD